jgi:hypothetical protein
MNVWMTIIELISKAQAETIMAANHAKDGTKHAQSVMKEDVLNVEVGSGRPILLD